MVVVVLGKRLHRSAAHESLRHQVDLGIHALRETDAEYLVLTGGRTNPEVDRSESDAMRAYALERGVDSDRIFIEEVARDTIGNSFFTRSIVDDLPNVDTVQIVTTCYHVIRARYVFEQCFGPAYDIEVADCYESAIPDDELAEEDALARTEAFFAPVTPGDLEAIRDRLLAEHDRYDETALEETDSSTARRLSTNTDDC